MRNDKLARKVVQSVPMIPALKAIIAHFGEDPGFVTVRPPLIELSVDENAKLFAGLKTVNFAMPGLKAALSGAAVSV